MPVLTGIPHDELLELEEAFADRVLRLFRDLVRAAAGGVGATLTAASSPAAVSIDDLASIPARWSEHVDGELLDYVGEVYRDGAGYISLDVLEALPDDVTYDLPAVSDEAALSYLRGRRNHLVGVGDDLWVEARAELVEGMRLGESVPRLRERVIAVGIEGEARADRVARTEVNGAANAGAYDQMVSLGVDAEKEWIDTSDGRTRETHVAVGGTRVGIRETFLVGGHPMPRPHDGPAGEVVNCRCTLAFHVTDEALAALVDEEDSLTTASLADRVFHLDRYVDPDPSLSFVEQLKHGQEIERLAREARQRLRDEGGIGARLASFVEDYTGQPSHDVRDRLRTEMLEGEWNDVIDVARSGTHAPSLFRGVRGDIKIVRDFIKKLRVGDDIDHRGLGSYTTNREHAATFGEEGFGNLFIELEDARGLSIEGMSNTPYEREWLIPGRSVITHIERRSRQHGKKTVTDTYVKARWEPR